MKTIVHTTKKIDIYYNLQNMTYNDKTKYYHNL